MSKKLFVFVAFIVISSMVLSACGPAAAPVVSQNVEISIDNAPEVEESSTAEETKNDPPPTEETKNDPPPTSKPDYSDLSIDYAAIYFRRPEPTYNTGSCGASYLMEFDTVIVSFDLGNNSIRKEPSADSKKFGEVGPGTMLKIYGEPVCDKKHGVIYWRTNALGRQNVFVPESGGGEMWLTHIGNYDNVDNYLPAHLIDDFVYIVGIINNEEHDINDKEDYLENAYWNIVNKYGEDTFLAIVDVLPAFTRGFEYSPAHFGYIANYVWWKDNIPKNSDFFRNMPETLAEISNGTSGAELERYLGID